jgi:hypothetical protein
MDAPGDPARSPGDHGNSGAKLLVDPALLGLCQALRRQIAEHLIR